MTDKKALKTILIFIDWFSPGYKAGGPIQSVKNITNYFSGKFNFMVITRDTDHNERTPYQNINSNCWNKLGGNLQVYYFSDDQLNYKNVKKLISTIEYDTVYLNSIYSWNFTFIPILLNKRRKRIVIAPRGMLQQGALSVKPIKKKIFLSIFKFFNLHKNIYWQATDNQEEIDIEKAFGKDAKVRLAENIPDTNSYHNEKLIKESGSLRLATISLITIKKNIDFFIDLLADVNLPVQYDIYGPKKDPEYSELCERKILKISKQVEIRFMGSIKPDEFHETISKYHFFVLPTLGENFGHAVFQALNSWRPVIISDKTPWRELETSRAGWDIPLHQKEIWKNIVEKCYAMDQNEFDSLCQGAQQVAKNYLKNADFTKQYDRLFVPEF